MNFKKVAVGAASLAVIGLGTGIPAQAALHYYDNPNYRTYLGSIACIETKVMHDAPDDVIDSINNDTGCAFSARSWALIPNTTIEIEYLVPGERKADLGDRRNQIDHFDRRG